MVQLLSSYIPALNLGLFQEGMSFTSQGPSLEDVIKEFKTEYFKYEYKLEYEYYNIPSRRKLFNNARRLSGLRKA